MTKEKRTNTEKKEMPTQIKFENYESKYVNETETRLDPVFKKAQNSSLTIVSTHNLFPSDCVIIDKLQKKYNVNVTLKLTS